MFPCRSDQHHVTLAIACDNDEPGLAFTQTAQQVWADYVSGGHLAHFVTREFGCDIGTYLSERAPTAQTVSARTVSLCEAVSSDFSAWWDQYTAADTWPDDAMMCVIVDDEMRMVIDNDRADSYNAQRVEWLMAQHETPRRRSGWLSRLAGWLTAPPRP